MYTCTYIHVMMYIYTCMCIHTCTYIVHVHAYKNYAKYSKSLFQSMYSIAILRLISIYLVVVSMQHIRKSGIITSSLSLALSTSKSNEMSINYLFIIICVDAVCHVFYKPTMIKNKWIVIIAVVNPNLHVPEVCFNIVIMSVSISCISAVFDK